MTALDYLPDVKTFAGVDLKTGSLVVAALGIVHPMAYGCTLFIPMSYMLLTVWALITFFFAVSIVLFIGSARDDTLMMEVWIWYALIFVAVMLMMMILMAVVFTSRKQRNRVCVCFLGFLWYILTIYFILVVNSRRKEVEAINNVHKKITDKGGVTTTTTGASPLTFEGFL